MHFKRGFTIVELLIVIVVIGILAALVISTFSSAQTRAANTQTTQVVKDYMKAMSLYVQDKGGYSTAGGCLGDAYTTGKCLAQDTTGTTCFGLGTGNTSSTLNDHLRPYLGGKLPMPHQQQVACGTTTYSGAWTYYNTGVRAPVIYMVQKGDVTCPQLSPVASSSKQFSGDVSLCGYVMPTLN